uniref:Secreted protein n=1 Tax=Anopheles darlingi TaxID=43151 RepID=A0A2M4DJM0_ANODA
MLLLLLLLLLLMLLRRVDGGCCRREHRNGKHTEARECACPLPDRAETQRRRSSANCASPTLFVFRVSHAAAILAYRRRWLTFLCSPTATFFARRLQSDHSFHLLPLPSRSLSSLRCVFYPAIIAQYYSSIFASWFRSHSHRSRNPFFFFFGFIICRVCVPSSSAAAPHALDFGFFFCFKRAYFLF